MFSAVMVFLPLLSGTCGENPAIQVTVTDKGLQYGTFAVAGWVQEHLGSVTIPDLSGDIDIMLGSIYYTIKGIKVTQCDFPKPSVEFFQNTTGFKASLSGLDASLTGQWTTDFGIIHDGGSFNAAIFGVDILSLVKLERDPDGRLSLSSIYCLAEVKDVGIRIHGGASWIVQLIVDHFRGHIRADLETKICSEIEKSIVDLELHLQTFNVSYDVNEVLSLDLPLTGSPHVSASDLNLGLKGEFYCIKTHTEPPFEAQPFTIPPLPGYMLSVGLSEFTMNSASFGYFSSGRLQALITDSMIPPGCPVRLNTTSMNRFIPKLPETFLDLLMVLLIYAREAPMLSLQPDAGKLSMHGAAKAFAIFPNGTQTPLFTLNSDFLFSIKTWIAGGRVKGSAKMDNFTLSLASSEVGPILIDNLKNIMGMFLKMVVLPKLNKIFGNGTDLPTTKYGRLVNSVLKMEEGFITLSSDMELLLMS